ncbi:hypothetical protein O9993_12645 [Vibrio lentus]|nr:hypothetical protein [Vibrio lentus]
MALKEWGFTTKASRTIDNHQIPANITFKGHNAGRPSSVIMTFNTFVQQSHAAFTRIRSGRYRRTVRSRINRGSSPECSAGVFSSNTNGPTTELSRHNIETQV